MKIVGPSAMPRDSRALEPCLRWTFYVILPMLYLLLLPVLAQLDPFGRGTFAKSGRVDAVQSFTWYPPNDSASLSRYISSGAAGGSFAAITAPAIQYVWTNPLSRRRRTVAMAVGAGALTLGWFGLIVLPVSFGSHEAHAIAWALFLLGYAVHALACLAVHECSRCISIYVVATLPLVACSSLLYFTHTLAWLVVQFTVACAVLVHVPLLNTLLATREAKVPPRQGARTSCGGLRERCCCACSCWRVLVLVPIGGVDEQAERDVEDDRGAGGGGDQASCTSSAGHCNANV